jgi:putative transposase
MEEKKIKGHKRHIVTDTQGHLLHVKVHAANIHDTIAGCMVFEEAIAKYPSLKGVCADAGYRKTMEEFIQKVLKRTIEISERIASGWVVIAKRWIVERTFAWLNHFRRLSKDYEI